MDDHRFSSLSQRMDTVEGTTHRIDVKLDGIAETLQSLARIEERQLATTERLREGAQTFSIHEERIRDLEVKVPEDVDKRLVAIEVAMPGLQESRKWVVTMLVACTAMILISLGHLIVKGWP